MSPLAGVRLCLAIVVASGVTAFPLDAELALASDALHASSLAEALPGLTAWVDRVAEGLAATYAVYPFMAYGTDWLAFAHLGIALAFVGPLRDPVRNVWVVRWAALMCAGIVPLALIAGSLRGLPWGWHLIDIGFGAVAIVPLGIALRLIRRLAQRSASPDATPSAHDA